MWRVYELWQFIVAMSQTKQFIVRAMSHTVLQAESHSSLTSMCIDFLYDCLYIISNIRTLPNAYHDLPFTDEDSSQGHLPYCFYVAEQALTFTSAWNQKFLIFPPHTMVSLP